MNQNNNYTVKIKCKQCKKLWDKPALLKDNICLDCQFININP